MSNNNKHSLVNHGGLLCNLLLSLSCNGGDFPGAHLFHRILVLTAPSNSPVSLAWGCVPGKRPLPRTDLICAGRPQLFGWDYFRGFPGTRQVWGLKLFAYSFVGPSFGCGWRHWVSQWRGAAKQGHQQTRGCRRGRRSAERGTSFLISECFFFGFFFAKQLPRCFGKSIFKANHQQEGIHIKDQ